MSGIHATAIVDPGARLGSDVRIGPYCVVGGDVELGDEVELISHVVVTGLTKIGARTRVHPFASLGGPPQHTRYAGEKVELIVGERAIIREYVTMNTGTPFGRGKTMVGNDGYFMISSHVAHDCLIGDHVIFTNNAVVGGHVEVGDDAMLGGNSAVHQYVRIGRHAFVGGMSGLENDLIPFGSCLGDRAELAGLNIVGLKRRGFTRETIHRLRSAYRKLFAAGGTLESRLKETEEEYADTPEVMEITRFVRAGNHRALCMPRSRRGAMAQDADD